MTDPKELRRLSKFLSLVLRHKPETVGLALEPGGWLPIDDLIAGARAQGVPLDRPTLLQIVAENDKRRFAFNGDQTKIRASQGHSVPIDLGLVPQQPPPFLYHGTATRFLDSIKIQGLLPQGRNHVHLSRDQETARAVGQRYGKPVVLTIDAATMYDNGHAFLVSANGVWLTLHVPVAFIDFPRTAP